LGKKEYLKAKSMIITADCMNLIGSRSWELDLQALANDLGIPMEMSHFPPGTFKFNCNMYPLFSVIGTNWCISPVSSYETVIHLIQEK
jgi:hypothetical protein